MRKILIILIMFSFFTKATASNSGSAYDHEFKSIDGDYIKLNDYKGKIIVVVNVTRHNIMVFNYFGKNIKIKV